jgi:hypothetical protein
VRRLKVFVALLECRHFEHLLKENSGVDVKWLVEDFANFSALLEANRVRKINHDQYKDTARYFPLAEEGESRECLGSWINSSAVLEAKKRRAKQVITCSFPCRKWLHMIGARASPGCELFKRERRKDMTSTDALPMETVAHIQSAGCNALSSSASFATFSRLLTRTSC